MDTRDADQMFWAALHAIDLIGELTSVQRAVTDGAHKRHEEAIEARLHDIAHFLGYRVERIGDGINTGKPAVVGGV